MNEEPQLQILLEDVKTYLGPFPDTKDLCEEIIMEVCIKLYLYYKLYKISYCFKSNIKFYFRYPKISYLDIRNSIN